MRAPFVIALLMLALTGCQDLGLVDADPQEMTDRYAGEDSRFIEVDGVGVHTRAEGDGPALLLLHGALDSLHAWDPWVTRLVDDYRIIRIDIPPFGLSEPRPDGDYEPDFYIPVFNAVLDAYDVQQAIVAGNSLGGFFAAYYAAQAPERVRALVLISPAGYPQRVPLSLRLAATPGVGNVFEYVVPRPLVRRSVRSMYGDPDRLKESAVQHRFDLLRVPGNRAAARDVIRVMVDRADDEPDWVSRITQPTLLLWGAKDEWVPPALAERWLEDLPDARLTAYPDVGHLAMEEIPDTSVAEFRRFLAERGIGDSP